MQLEGLSLEIPFILNNIMLKLIYYIFLKIIKTPSYSPASSSLNGFPLSLQNLQPGEGRFRELQYKQKTIEDSSSLLLI